MIPSTVERVPEHTAEHVNEQIRRQTEENVARYAAAGPAAVERRLADLDREWDIEPPSKRTPPALSSSASCWAARWTADSCIFPPWSPGSCSSTPFRAGVPRFPSSAVWASAPSPRSTTSATP